MLNLNHTGALRELLRQMLADNEDGVRGLTNRRDTLSFLNALQLTLFVQFARIDMHDVFTNEGHRRLVSSNGSNVGVQNNSDLAQNAARHGALQAVADTGGCTMAQLKRNQEKSPGNQKPGAVQCRESSALYSEFHRGHSMPLTGPLSAAVEGKLHALYDEPSGNAAAVIELLRRKVGKDATTSVDDPAQYRLAINLASDGFETLKGGAKLGRGPNSGQGQLMEAAINEFASQAPPQLRLEGPSAVTSTPRAANSGGGGLHEVAAASFAEFGGMSPLPSPFAAPALLPAGSTSVAPLLPAVGTSVAPLLPAVGGTSFELTLLPVESSRGFRFELTPDFARDVAVALDGPREPLSARRRLSPRCIELPDCSRECINLGDLVGDGSTSLGDLGHGPHSQGAAAPQTHSSYQLGFVSGLLHAASQAASQAATPSAASISQEDLERNLDRFAVRLEKHGDGNAQEAKQLVEKSAAL